jgi:hypothetical protein
MFYVRPSRQGKRPDVGTTGLHVVVFNVGYPDYELKPGGSEVAVDASNVEEYLSAVVNATLGEGIAAQLTAFRHVPVQELWCVGCQYLPTSALVHIPSIWS